MYTFKYNKCLCNRYSGIINYNAIPALRSCDSLTHPYNVSIHVLIKLEKKQIL